MTEADFLAALRRLPLHAGAHGLSDDAAHLGDLVLTKDLLVAGVHFLALDPPADVAWKLVATNLSDLAAKGAVPVGVMLGYPIGDDAWDRAFLTGLDDVLRTYDCPLLGGDTVKLPPQAPRILSLTAIGRSAHAPRRDGARVGDGLWITGTVGDAGAGLAIAQGAAGPPSLLARYRRPTPRLAEGQVLAPVAHAMMDVSDGLLIDARRMAAASGLAVTIDLALVPLSDDLEAFGHDALTAATAGDDYELLFACDTQPPVAATRIGTFASGKGLTLLDGGRPIPLPDRLGYQH
ncbi:MULTISPECIES: thiamine-phosphate kinase [unclassified Sphingomonas]|uniref:thiamine-phosphate kinase n=1 Tax=unclassified Sphingomonas TaxID=196159 RepID=UPI0006FD0EDE|nr:MULTISPECIES: thiamine-phosphate kinase [unclassified Sphingomonas]KQM61952.1 thiamine-monophosphate kinase [Sphingomonas sp. Leaf16]KQN13244.1 thiamine-monophosphate kinase [Sphingomonas sp. Leaf29]KQN20127.1 thiamine-monophosphate kinase [Sphingomonas sp. Leaf32]